MSQNPTLPMSIEIYIWGNQCRLFPNVFGLLSPGSQNRFPISIRKTSRMICLRADPPTIGLKIDLETWLRLIRT